MNDYSIEPINTSKEGLEATAQLLQNCFPTEAKFTVEFLRWQYADNPIGKVHGYNAFKEGELAAHYATIPVQYTVHGRVRKGLLSLNTATGINHRGKKLFKTLAEKTYSTAAENGYDFVIGVANANSTHGFVNKMDFQLVSPLAVKVGVGSVAGNKNHADLCGHHSEEWYKWRTSNPAHNYVKRKLGTYSQQLKPGLRAILTQDFKDENSVFFGGCLWIGLSPDKKSKGIMFELPDRLKPSPLNLIFRDLKGDIGNIDKEKVHFELFDFDAY
jgi:hypothetical protein